MRSVLRFGAVVLFVAAMYASLGAAREIAEALRNEGRLAATVDGLALAMGFVVLRLALTEDDPTPTGGLQPKSLIAGVLFAVAAYGLATQWNLPEERFHLPQYFAIGLLLHWATAGRVSVALPLALAIGLGDELVQGSLPNRTFDLRDLLANASCGGAAVLFLGGGRGRFVSPVLLAICWAVLAVFPPYIAPAPIADATPAPIVHPAMPQVPPTLGPGSPISPPTGPYGGASVILITIDALRADHVPPWGSAPVPTPHLARFQQESVAFSEALSEAAWTSPGIVSLLTGLSPAVHGVETRGHDLNPAIETPLDRLRDAGYRTLGFAADDSETYRYLGFETALQRDVPPEVALATGLDVAAAASPDAPIFAWLHFRHVHAPYEASPRRLLELGFPDDLPDAPILNRARIEHTVPRSMFPGRHHWLRPAIRSLYASEVADADAALGAVLALLEERGLLDEAIVVLSADHGEELLEHHGIGHASTTLDTVPHPEVTQIPMLVRLPDGRGAGKILAQRFVQSDLAPTLLPLLGVPSPPMTGQDYSERVLHGPNLKASNPREADYVAPTRGVLLSTSPCGWQCPIDRRSERAHAWVSEGDRVFCRANVHDHAQCPTPIREALDAAAIARGDLGPVPSR